MFSEVNADGRKANWNVSFKSSIAPPLDCYFTVLENILK